MSSITTMPGRAWRWLAWKTRRRRPRTPPPGSGAPPAHHLPPPICADLRGWCEADTGATYQVILDAHRIVRRPPRTIEPTVHEVFERYYAVDAPEQALVGVRGASVLTNGLILLPDGSLAGDVVTHMLEFRDGILANEPAYTHPLPTTRRELEGNYYPLVIGNAFNYYHWQQDVMIPLIAVLPHLPADVRFIVPPDLKDFHHAMLDAVGLTAAERFVFPRTEVWTCEHLFFSTPYLKPMLHTAQLTQPFVDRCLDAYGITDRTPSKRIYISRQHDNHWRTTNEPEVVAMLEGQGFESHDLAQLTFPQQVALFAQAEVIVGTGAGLSNMIFAASGAKILQTQDPSYPVGHHFTISSAMDHQYWYFFADAVPNPESRFGRANLHVPPDKLRESLEQLAG